MTKSEIVKQFIQQTKAEIQHNKYVQGFWKLLLGACILVIFVFLLASWGVFGKLPTFEVLENPQTNLATEVISSDGKTLGKYYFNENRTPITYNDLPKHLVNALVATEDQRYYKHAGIDAKGTVRAVIMLGRRGGASTITQQLAKLLFTERVANNIFSRSIQKIKEWIIAIRLEKQYTKEEIIAMYLNIYDFNYNADGIRSASRIYFGKEPKDLNTEESAVLIGMLKNSSLYNPIRRTDLVKNRRNTVLNQMYKNDYLTKKERDSLKQLDLTLNFNPESHSEGIATYFRMYLQEFLKEWIEKNPKPDGSKYNLYLDGLKVYTTIDYRMQKYAEEAMKEHMKRLQAEFFVQNTNKRNKTAPFIGLSSVEIQKTYERAMKQSERWSKMEYMGFSESEIRASFKKETEMTIFDWKGEKDTVMTPLDSIKYYKHFLRASLMSMEPQTGFVRAWVGGINYKHFQYDQVKQGARQSGSTFKPFVYATAIDQLHLSPCDSLPDVLYCVEAHKYGNLRPWCPQNSDGKYSGKMRTLKDALANSINTITARLIDQVGPQPVIAMSKQLGISADIPPAPSIALGTADISLYEMVGAYGAFANEGVYVKPLMITRIEDKNGTVLYEYLPETKDALSKDVAYTMVNLLQGVTQYGSGARLRHSGNKNAPVYKEIITGYPYQFTNPIAGKTGTTQNQSDGWFIGMVPNLVTGVWVGGEDRAIHFRSLSYGQGASTALPMWALYMQKCYKDPRLEVSKEDFKRPEYLSISMDCSRSSQDEEPPFDEPDF